jgi:hypothetical protein
MRGLFESTAREVMYKVLYDVVKNESIDDLIGDQGNEPEKWISMDNYRNIDSSVMKALREASGLDNDDLFKGMAANVRQIVDEETTTYCYTYEIFCDQILKKKDCTQEEFIDYITKSKKFYEGFFKEHKSYSRSREFDINPNGDIEKMAYDIVFKNVMHKDKIFQNNEHYGLYKFTSQEFKDMTEQEKKKYLRTEISKCFKFVYGYSSEQDDSDVWQNINKIADYPTIADESGSRDEFINKLVEQILIYADNLQKRRHPDRKGVLYEWFEKCCRDGGNANDFANEVDNNAQELNFDGFNPLRFHDAFLYLCMKTESPMDTFNKLNVMNGYSY